MCLHNALAKLLLADDRSQRIPTCDYAVFLVSRMVTGYWLRAQAAHETEIAQVKLAKVLDEITPWVAIVAENVPSHHP